MDRKTFIKLSSVTMTGTLLKPGTTFYQEKQITNWAGNFIYSTNNLYYPHSLTEVQDLIKKYPKIKVLAHLIPISQLFYLIHL